MESFISDKQKLDRVEAKLLDVTIQRNTAWEEIDQLKEQVEKLEMENKSLKGVLKYTFGKEELETEN